MIVCMGTDISWSRCTTHQNDEIVYCMIWNITQKYTIHDMQELYVSEGEGRSPCALLHAR